MNNFDGLRGWHRCTDEWKINDTIIGVYVRGAIQFLQEREPQIIRHTLIGWRIAYNPSAEDAEDFDRYSRCDVDCPGILVYGAPNPMGRPYRMIDGKHRLCKIMKTTNKCESAFYVLSKEEFYAIISDDQWVIKHK